MSATGKVWANNNPPSCEDADLNGFKNENNNLIEGSGQALSTADNQQTHKAVSVYAAGGDFYTDSGTANVYFLSTVGAKVAPPDHFPGMRVRWVPGNDNTGACTVNVATIGATAIKREGGTDPVAGDIRSGEQAIADFDDVSGFFILVRNVQSATAAREGIVELANNAETQTGTDGTKAVTPAGLTARTATTARYGIIELATNAETQAGADTVRAVTPAGLESKTATETRKGIAEVATQAEADAGLDDERMITPLKLANFPLSPGAATVGQAELKTTTGEVSTSSTSAISIVLPSGEYGLYPQLKSSAGNVAIWDGGSTTSASYVTTANLNIAISGTAYLQIRYMQASPPYFDADDNLIGRYIFVEIDKNTGDVVAIYNAQEAPWHYNGPTDIRGRILRDKSSPLFGKKVRARRDMTAIPFTLAEARGDKGKLQEYRAAFASAPTIYEEITQDIKDADMHLIPRPMEQTADTVVVLLDPISDLNHELSELCIHDEFNLNELLHSGMFTIDSVPLARPGPPGVDVVGFNWK